MKFDKVTLVMYIVTCVPRLGLSNTIHCMGQNSLHCVQKKNTHVLTFSFISPRMMHEFKPKNAVNIPKERQILTM